MQNTAYTLPHRCVVFRARLSAPLLHSVSRGVRVRAHAHRCLKNILTAYLGAMLAVYTPSSTTLGPLCGSLLGVIDVGWPCRSHSHFFSPQVRGACLRHVGWAQFLPLLFSQVPNPPRGLAMGMK